MCSHWPACIPYASLPGSRGSHHAILLAAGLFHVHVSGLALFKRYSELMTMKRSGDEKTRGRGYEVGDLTILQSAGLASGYIAVPVFALYVNSPDIGICTAGRWSSGRDAPSCCYGSSRIWMITHRGDMDDDPIVFAFRDGPEYRRWCVGGVCVHSGLVTWDRLCFLGALSQSQP